MICRYLAIVSLLLSVSTAASVQSQVYGSAHHAYRVVTVVEGLQIPWAMAWLPGGDMLVTERSGRLRIVRNGMLVQDPVPGLPGSRVAERTVVANKPLQVEPVEVLHGVVELTVGRVSVVVDGHVVGMLQAAGLADLQLKSGDCLLTRFVNRKQLDGRWATQ